MPRKILYIVFLVLFMFSCASRSKEVLDKESAAKIAREALAKSMTQDEIANWEPLEAILIDGKLWQVYPKDILEFGGLVPLIYIKKKNGKVKSISWDGDTIL